MLESFRRPLTPAEGRLLRAKARSVAARGRRASPAHLAAAGGIILVLWLWTVLASDAPWTIITAFWILVGTGIAAWARHEARAFAGEFANMAAGLQSALRRNEADEYTIRATGFADFEEIDDEGGCYAFEIGDGRVAFIQGQEFYESARFPSLDFSLVYVLDEAGKSVDMLINKRGTKAPPARRIPAAVKQRLNVPDHLEVRVGTIADLEELLGGVLIIACLN